MCCSASSIFRFPRAPVLGEKQETFRIDHGPGQTGRFVTAVLDPVALEYLVFTHLRFRKG
jgi:hypothetical protein